MKVKSSKHSKVFLAAEGVSSDFVLFVLLLEVIPDFSSVNYFCLKNSDERPRESVCVCVCVSVYIKKHSVCSRCSNRGRSWGGELCVSVCATVIVCVCVFALRQLAEEVGHVSDHTGHWRRLAGSVWRLRRWCHQLKPMALHPLKVKYLKALRERLISPQGRLWRTLQRSDECVWVTPHCVRYIWLWERHGTFGGQPEFF